MSRYSFYFDPIIQSMREKFADEKAREMLFERCRKVTFRNMKKIAVLTSGGDAPGMNAVIRSVVRTACSNGIEVVGIRYGFKGLIEENFVELDIRKVCDIIHRGGTVLYTTRYPLFKNEDIVSKAVEIANKHGIEGLVVIGGDGSFRGVRDLSNFGLPCVAVPGTIDNDIGCTDYTIGFDTALNNILYTVDCIRDTIESHSRCSVIEVMGAHAGHLALAAGVAAGATAILVPEIPYDIENDIIERIRRTAKADKHHFIIMVAEGIRLRDGITAEQIAEKIETETGIETRATNLGYIQRGGSPTVHDRTMASLMGNRAVHLLQIGCENRVVALRNNKLTDFDINDALEIKKDIDMELFNCAMEISL